MEWVIAGVYTIFRDHNPFTDMTAWHGVRKMLSPHPRTHEECVLTFTSWYTPIPASISLACSLSWSIQCVPCVTWVPCYITKGGACTGVHTTITRVNKLTTGNSYRKGHIAYTVKGKGLPVGVSSRNESLRFNNFQNSLLKWPIC